MLLARMPAPLTAVRLLRGEVTPGVQRIAPERDLVAWFGGLGGQFADGEPGRFGVGKAEVLAGDSELEVGAQLRVRGGGTPVLPGGEHDQIALRRQGHRREDPLVGLTSVRWVSP